jgi:hypothetical protein
MKNEKFIGREPRHRSLAVAMCIGLGMLIVILLTALFQRTRKLSLANGDVINITLAPVVVSLLSETSCKIVYQPQHGTNETIVLLQDSDSRPAMLIPAADGETFFCLYYADVRYRLMKIEPSKSPTSFSKTSYLSFIVISSSCHIESATTNEWYEVLQYLKTAPHKAFEQDACTIYDLGVWRYHFDRQELSDAVQNQIDNINWGVTN